jgi:hypothetical protein
MKKAFASFFQSSPMLRVALVLITIYLFPAENIYAQEGIKLPDE